MENTANYQQMATMASRKLLESMSREVCVCVSVSVSLSLCLSVSLPMAFCCLLCWWPVFPMLCVSTQCCCCCCCLLFVLAKALLRRCTELEQLLAKHGVPVPAAAMAGFRTTRKTKPQRQFDFSKYSKRKIIVWMKVAEIVVMVLGMIALQMKSWTLMLVVLFIMGLQSAFFGPSKYGVIPELVPPLGLMKANGVIAMTTFMGVLLGQALAGPLLDKFIDQLWITGAACVAFSVIGLIFSLRMGELERQKPDLPITPNPFGRLFEGPEDDTSVAIRAVLEETFGSHGPIIAVGDVTVKALQDLGSPADIALIDGKTKRQEWLFASKIDHSIYDTKRSCLNPPGQLSIDLFETCTNAISDWNEGKRTCIIEVDGEEDLAPLLLHPLAPLGAVVLYGQPNRGVVLRWTGFDSKSRCRDLLNGMQRA